MRVRWWWSVVRKCTITLCSEGWPNGPRGDLLVSSAQGRRETARCQDTLLLLPPPPPPPPLPIWFPSTKAEHWPTCLSSFWLDWLWTPTLRPFSTNTYITNQHPHTASPSVSERTSHQSVNVILVKLHWVGHFLTLVLARKNSKEKVTLMSLSFS